MSRASRDKGLPFVASFGYTNAQDLRLRADYQPWYKRLVQWLRPKKRSPVAWIVATEQNSPAIPQAQLLGPDDVGQISFLKPGAVLTPIYDQDLVDDLIIAADEGVFDEHHFG
jgi:hypothetical protein